MRSSVVAGLVNFLGLGLTLSLLAFGDPLAAGIVIGCLILVAGAISLYGRIWRDSVGGIYEVVHDIHEWQVLDHSGAKATMERTRMARVLQDEVFAIRDFAWGSKGSHVNPRCDPWHVAHEYPDRDRTTVILALEEVKNRDDALEYSIAWDVEGVFVDLENWVETEILHETMRLTMRVVFPGSRAPLKSFLTCSDSPDKREELAVRPRDRETFQVEHELWNPKRHHRYRITWRWAPDDLVARPAPTLAGPGTTAA